MLPSGPAVPSAKLPLGFLTAAGVALVGFGVGLFLAAHSLVTTPSASHAIAAVHLGLLACLSTAVLGASHQFGPVVGGAPLRSERAGFVTLTVFVPAVWLIPLGFASDRPGVLQVGGVLATCALLIATWNLSRPLLRRGKGTPVDGLRLAVVYFVVTALFGVTYAFDRSHGWFILWPPRVLAHAHLGLLGWLGLAYFSVAEKLWPMFLLAHPRWTDPGTWAVRIMAASVPFLAVGLLWSWPPVVAIGIVGAVAAAIGHLLSLGSVIRNRRRAMDLLHAYVLVSAGFLVSAIAHGVVAAVAPVDTALRTRLVTVEVASLGMWLLTAVLGHAHKIVPFIVWGQLRKRGITKTPEGKPLLFAHLFSAPVAKACLVATTIGGLSLLGGMAGQQAVLVKIAGVLLGTAGVAVLANLISGPMMVIRTAERAAAVSPSPSVPSGAPS